MRAPAVLLRVAGIALLAQLATACALNPFDGDPNGRPPAPDLWDSAYSGDDDNNRNDGPRRTDRDEPEPRRVTTPSGDRDRSYGTSEIEAQPLPPPGEETSPSRADPPPPEVDDPPRGGRTLSTTESDDPADEPPPEPREEANAPIASGRVHTVRDGEELSDIADRYDVREVDIIALNRLKPPYRLKNGQSLKIPADDRASSDIGEEVVSGTEVIPRPKPKPGSKVAAADPAPEPSPNSEPDPQSEPEPTPAADAPRFDWPVSGKVIAGFGPGGEGLYNEGINIAVPEGTPVHASAPGTVRYAGNELRGYGNLVLIEHAGGFVTAYAHNQALTVKRGQKIARGAVVARSGKTGNVTSPQLHFEIRQGTKSVDPRKHLVAMN